MSDVEFTFDWYRSFLGRLRSSGFDFRPYGETVGEGDVILRHDVDLSPERAMEMARIERDHGVRSTYFFLLSSPLYNPFQRPVREAIAGIASLGHDVGLHFSTHQYWNADRPADDAEVTERVEAEREALSTVAPSVIPTVSFHIPPAWVLERTFEGFPSTYEPRFFGEIDYLADSGQRWREEGAAVPADGPLQVLAHPGLWGAEDRSFEGRVREAVVEADRRATDYAESRYLESASGRVRPVGTPDP